jgi:hypothetical protein
MGENLFHLYICTSEKGLINRIYWKLKKLNYPKYQWPNEEMDKWTEKSFLKGRSSNGQKTHKKWSPSLAVEEMQIKTTLRFYLTPGRMAIIKNTNNKCWWGCEEKGNLINCWWKCKLVQHLWKTVWRPLEKLKIELPYDLAIPFLCIYPKECKSSYKRHLYTHVYCSNMQNF